MMALLGVAPVVAAAVAVVVAFAGSAESVPTVLPGWAPAWWLPQAPAPVPPTPPTALFTSSGVSAPTIVPLLRSVLATQLWSAVNPAEGVFNFSDLHTRLADAKAQNCTLVARLKVSVTDRRTAWPSGDVLVPYIPPWVLTQCQPARCRTHNASSSSYIEVAVPWDACVQQKYAALVRAFVAEGFLADPAFLGVYVHGISKSAGEEMYLDADGMQSCEAAGMTPAVLEAAFLARFGAWVNATAGAPALLGKLAWVGMGWLSDGASPYDYNGRLQVAGGIDEQALRLGLGLRTGGMELYLPPFIRALRRATIPGYAYFDPFALVYNATDGVCDVCDEGDSVLPPGAAAEEIYAARRAGVFLGGEDEQWDAAGPSAPMFHSTMFVENFLETKFVWMPPENWLLQSGNTTLGLLAWFLRTAGLRRRDRPDSALWLREAWITAGSAGCLPLRNIGMGLRQRNVAVTPAALPFDRAVLSNGRFYSDCGPSSQHVENYGRRTNVSAGVPAFEFELLPVRTRAGDPGGGFVDATFAAGGERLCVVVAFLPQPPGSVWELRGPAGAVLGRVVGSAAPGAPDARNASFLESDAAAATAFFDVSAADILPSFSVHVAQGSADLALTLVRVVRHCDDGPPGTVPSAGSSSDGAARTVASGNFGVSVGLPSTGRASLLLGP